jgi:hypothetical protein
MQRETNSDAVSRGGRGCRVTGAATIMPSQKANAIAARLRRKSRRARSARKKKINSAARAERQSFTIYSGQNWLGSVEQCGARFTARAISGKKLGAFDTLSLAADAISATAEAA